MVHDAGSIYGPRIFSGGVVSALCNRGGSESRQARVSPAQHVLENGGHGFVSETSIMVINYSLKLMPQDAEYLARARFSAQVRARSHAFTRHHAGH